MGRDIFPELSYFLHGDILALALEGNLIDKVSGTCAGVQVLLHCAETACGGKPGGYDGHAFAANLHAFQKILKAGIALAFGHIEIPGTVVVVALVAVLVQLLFNVFLRR